VGQQLNTQHKIVFISTHTVDYRSGGYSSRTPLDFGGFSLRAVWMPLTVRQSSVSLPENCRKIVGKWRRAKNNYFFPSRPPPPLRDKYSPLPYYFQQVACNFRTIFILFYYPKTQKCSMIIILLDN